MDKKTFLVALLGAGFALALGVVAFYVWFYVSMERGEDRQRAFREEQRSGKYDFGDQPELFAVAQAIVQNDQEAIRAAAKAVRDLRAPGRDGMTLLCFAVRSSWQRPELVEAVKTLLALGLDPNYTNGQPESFAMANAAHGSADLLRTMLDAGGDPNTRDEFGRPIILMNWYLGYYKQDARARLDLLLERGADINSAMPDTESEFAGYPLLLYRIKRAPADDDNDAYADALYLLERGADANRAGRDGMTFAKMLIEHHERFRQQRVTPSRSFEALWQWAQAHGIAPELAKQ